MNDYANAFHMAAPYWAERGVATYAYDQRGFGRSYGRGEWPDEDSMREDLRTAVQPGQSGASGRHACSRGHLDGRGDDDDGLWLRPAPRGRRPGRAFGAGFARLGINSVCSTGGAVDQRPRAALAGSCARRAL